MKRKLITLAVMAALASTPALAAETGKHESRINSFGIVAGGVLGALVGGPPGAIAGMAVGGITTDREVTARRAQALDAQVAALGEEQRSLQSARHGLQAQVETLHRALERERELAANTVDAGSLADGLEFAVAFRTNTAEFPEEVAGGLEALASLVTAVPSLEVRLDGYADPRGSAQLNQQLSLARAEAIRDRLIAAGIEPQRIHVHAHGAVAADEGQVADADSWALQRRVDIRLERRAGQLAARP